MTRFCVLIPTYNNVSTIEDMVVAVLPYGYPVIVVDDGSNAETAAAIDRAAQDENVTCIRRSRNGGKGAAIEDGMTYADSRGFTHAIQVDADGQHAVEDIPRFVAAAAASPESLVLGSPLFSDDAPRGRMIGRKISVFWTRVSILSAAIKDPLFGYRVYPVQASMVVFRSARVGRRMDFDAEIAVRLYWNGLNVINIDTKVTYPEGGLSSFSIFWDNVRISWMFTRLFFGMMCRIWKLLARRQQR